MSAFDRLLEQIDVFIRKYYKDLIVKGLVLFIGVLLLTFLTVVTLEYFGKFGTTIRATLFFTFIFINLYILVRYIFIPSFRLNSLGNRIDRFAASQIIGRFFPEISDRLLNTLQLNAVASRDSRDFELIQASVMQRSNNMNSYRFTDAIDISKNKKYAAYVLPVVFVMASIAMFNPSFFKDSTERLVYFNEESTANTFSFKLIADKNEIQEGETYTFRVELTGEELPSKVYIVSPRGKFLLRPITGNIYEGELVQLRESLKFSFEALNSREELVKSNQYAVRVIGKSAIGKFEATISYPSYLGLEDEVIQNAGDLIVPEGSRVKWSVLTKNTSQTSLTLNGKTNLFKSEGFGFSEQFFQTTEGLMVLSNREDGSVDSTGFTVSVVKDAYPTIQVEQETDTIKSGVRYFSGLITDDHGLSGLKFHYVITGKDGGKRNESMGVTKVSGTEMPFNFAVDFRKENIKLDDVVEYYFTVTDNDGVNKGKTTRSKTFVYKVPGLEDVNEKRNEDQKETQENLSNILKQTEKFQKDIEHLKKDVMNNKSSSWSKENQVQQLKQEQKSIVDQLQQLKEKLDNSTEEKNQLSEIDEELLKQQEEIEKLLEELMDEELMELLEKLEELMKSQNQDELQKNMEDLELSAEDMKKQLERSKEMLKRLQVNEKIDDIEDELNKLAEEQEELNKSLENKDNKVDDSDKKAQDELNDKFNQLKDDLNELDSLNKNLDNPMELNGMEELSDEIQEEMNEAKKNLDKNSGKKAGEKQKSAAEKMKEMAEQIDQMQAQSNQEQQQEDMGMLRGILESLVILSLDQEEVMGKLRMVDDNDPAFKKYSVQQRKIISDTRIVRDSLYALAKRQPKIASFIDQELNNIKVNQELALEDIDERRRGMMTAHQQFTMTSYNNLALMLNESLQQMQQQMQSMMQSSGSCTKPGGGKPKPGQGSPGNQDLKKMLQDQLKQMEQGQKPGGQKPGEKPGQGSMGLGNKQLAKMAAEQSAIRKRLEEMRNELNKDGKGTGNKLNPLIDELEKQEKDLINKRLDNNLIERQREILTRLLESEKALMERGLDDKRESKEGKNENYSNQILLDEYKMEKLKQIELLRSVDPSYKKYYKDRANEYFNRM